MSHRPERKPESVVYDIARAVIAALKNRHHLILQPASDPLCARGPDVPIERCVAPEHRVSTVCGPPCREVPSLPPPDTVSATIGRPRDVSTTTTIGAEKNRVRSAKRDVAHRAAPRGQPSAPPRGSNASDVGTLCLFRRKPTTDTVWNRLFSGPPGAAGIAATPCRRGRRWLRCFVDDASLYGATNGTRSVTLQELEL